MGKVIFDLGISLDGFLAGENRGPQNPLGDEGTSIHNWMFKQKAFWRKMNMENGEEEGPDGKLIENVLARTGAYIMGKRMFEEGEPNWPENLFKADVFVLTHEKREPWVQKGNTTFYFVNDTIENVLAQAKKSAGDKDVRIQGGRETVHQFLNAGLIDEGTVHIAPVFLGKGIRLFDGIAKDQLEITAGEVAHSPLATHITYYFNKK